LGETFQSAAKGVGGRAHSLVIDGHGDKRAFVEVYDQPRGRSKIIEDALEPCGGAIISTEDDEGDVCILQDERREPVDDRMLEHPVALDHPLQHIDNEDEEVSGAQCRSGGSPSPGLAK
jgi:hypothetical protein